MTDDSAIRSSGVGDGHSPLRASTGRVRPETPEERGDRIIYSARQRQLDRQASVAEISREFKAIFDRLQREFKARDDFEPKFSETPTFVNGVKIKGKYVSNPVFDAMPEGKEFANTFTTNANQRREAAELYRAIGREAVLAKWEDFLVNEDHNVTQPVTDDEGKIIGSEIVERTHLLRYFLQLHGAPAEVASGTWS